jgi:hypothetical protein
MIIDEFVKKGVVMVSRLSLKKAAEKNRKAKKG